VSELKPCPFCGSIADSLDTPSGVFARCSQVGCIAGQEEYFYIETWNERPLENRLKKAIDIMLKAIEFAQDMTFTKTVIRERLKNSRKEAIKILTASNSEKR